MQYKYLYTSLTATQCLPAEFDENLLKVETENPKSE